ncbi:MAG TPA: MBL fold metallo-hydrolase [Acidimicrobiales bacterium]|nr:MBL fold metallo-hydrolase [Acidimicrobiales bacterium]
MPSGTLTVLGCDGSYPGPGGAASGYLVKTAAATIWLDAGSGTFARLQEVCFPGTVDAIVLSHDHPDHWSDIESFAVWARHQSAGEPHLVLAPPGLRERSYFGDDPSFDWREVEPSFRIDVHDLRCSFVATDHGPPTLAVRIEKSDASPDDKPFAYSADTGPDWSVEELGDDIGLFLCEATYTKDREGDFRHLSGRQAGIMGAGAGVGDLVVTHRWPTVGADALALEAAEAFGRAVYQAAPGLTLEW